LIPEVPKANHSFTSTKQLVILIVHYHGMASHCLKLEKQLLCHQVIFVNDLVHTNEEEVTRLFVTHLLVLNLRIGVDVSQLVVVSLNTLGS